MLQCLRGKAENRMSGIIRKAYENTSYHFEVWGTTVVVFS